MPYFLYILKCSDGSLYTGISTDVERRLREHMDGKGANYTRSRGVVGIVYTKEYSNRSSALKEEARIKKLSKEEKILLIKRHTL